MEEYLQLHKLPKKANSPLLARKFWRKLINFSPGNMPPKRSQRIAERRQNKDNTACTTLACLSCEKSIVKCQNTKPKSTSRTLKRVKYPRTFVRKAYPKTTLAKKIGTPKVKATIRTVTTEKKTATSKTNEAKNAKQTKNSDSFDEAALFEQELATMPLDFIPVFSTPPKAQEQTNINDSFSYEGALSPVSSIAPDTNQKSNNNSFDESAAFDRELATMSLDFIPVFSKPPIKTSEPKEDYRTYVIKKRIKMLWTMTIGSAEFGTMVREISDLFSLFFDKQMHGLPTGPYCPYQADKLLGITRYDRNAFLQEKLNQLQYIEIDSRQFVNVFYTLYRFTKIYHKESMKERPIPHFTTALTAKQQLRATRNYLKAIRMQKEKLLEKEMVEFCRQQEWCV